MSTTVAAEHHMVPHACTQSTINDISKDRTRISKRVDNSEEESRVLELASRDLGEVPLSEEDKLLNCKLIEEAERLSQTHNRHRTRRSRTSSVELSRSQTFDDSDGDDVFLSPTLQSPSIPRNEMPQSYFTPERTISTQDSGLASERTSVTSALHGSSNSTTIPVTCNTQAPPLDCSVPPRESGATPSDKDYTHQGTDGVTSSAVNHLTHHHSPQQLNQIKEENLAKKRNLIKQSKMPELAESSETESMRGNGGSEHSEQDGAHKESNGVSDNHQDKMPSNKEKDPLAFPSLPNNVLREMGLEAKSTANGEEEVLSDQEIEEKYSSLALAFKTDSLTLNKRISLQERSRDVAEQNIDTELKGLKDTLKTLGPFCNDQHSRDIYGKIQSHLDILEQSTTRMSSRAEVHGAVQQELRMSKAIDVMITHVDNLKRLYEKEHSELEETRKLLHGTKLGGVNGTEPGTEGVLHKRSFSMAPGTGVKFTGRRRASVAAFPQAFPRRTSLLAMNSMNINQTLDSNNDVRSRLEACTPGDITTTTTASNSVDSVTLLEQQTPSSSQITPSHTPPIVYSSPPLRRRASTIDKHFSNNYDNTSTQLQNLSDRLSDFERERTQDPARLSPRRSTSSPAGMMESTQSSGSNNNNLTVNGSNSSNGAGGAGGTNEEERNSNDEEHIFQNGYEEGVRAHVSQDIEELREQQRDFQENLDVLMEQNSTTSDTYISAATTFVSNNYLTRLLLWWPTIWQRHKLQNHVRTTLAGIVLLMALLSFLFTFLPRTHADIRRFAYESIPWESVERILEPYTDKRHHDSPPV